MNLKLLRKIHLYLGIVFTPLLLFFLFTGAVQVFEWHKVQKGGYHPPEILHDLTDLHKHQRWNEIKPRRLNEPSLGFKVVVFLMAVGIFASTAVGVVMGFRYEKASLMWILLGTGVVVPLLCLMFL